MARRLLGLAAPAVTAAVRQGSLSLSGARNFGTRGKNFDDQNQHSPYSLRRGTGYHVHVQKALGIPDAPRLVKPKLIHQMATGLRGLKNYTEMIAKRLQESDTYGHPNMGQWMSELYNVRLAITH